jgi:hypothetical protein
VVSHAPIAVLILDTDSTNLPLWFEGLLEREDIALEPSTWDALAAWSDYFLRNYLTSYEWEPDADVDGYRREGDSLAARVAREIGSDYAVSHDGNVFRSESGPTNADAARDVYLLANDLI